MSGFSATIDNAQIQKLAKIMREQQNNENVTLCFKPGSNLLLDFVYRRFNKDHKLRPSRSIVVKLDFLCTVHGFDEILENGLNEDQIATLTGPVVDEFKKTRLIDIDKAFPKGSTVVIVYTIEVSVSQLTIKY